MIEYLALFVLIMIILSYMIDYTVKRNLNLINLPKRDIIRENYKSIEMPIRNDVEDFEGYMKIIEDRNYPDFEKMNSYQKKWFLETYPENMTKMDYMQWLSYQPNRKLNYIHRRNKELMDRGVVSFEIPKRAPPMHIPFQKEQFLGTPWRSL